MLYPTQRVAVKVITEGLHSPSFFIPKIKMKRGISMENIIYEKIATQHGAMGLEQVFIEADRKSNRGYEVRAYYMSVTEDYEIRYYFQSMHQISQAVAKGQNLTARLT